jgi:hypothetical protein
VRVQMMTDVSMTIEQMDLFTGLLYNRSRIRCLGDGRQHSLGYSVFSLIERDRHAGPAIHSCALPTWWRALPGDCRGGGWSTSGYARAQSTSLDVICIYRKSFEQMAINSRRANFLHCHQDTPLHNAPLSSDLSLPAHFDARSCLLKHPCSSSPIFLLFFISSNTAASIYHW